MKYFNLNSLVKVKFTDEGLKILTEQHKELLNSAPQEVKNKIGAFKLPEIDEEGYSEILMWELMQSFGRYMLPGNPKPPFESIIKISDEYLVEHTESKSKNR